MSTLAPVVGPAGIAAPDYPTILAQRQADYRATYGPDIILTPDSQDGQAVAIEAQAIYDVGQACVAVYNAFSPATAQGAGLSSVVKINGIARKIATASTATVTLTGVAGTTIANGVVGDNQSLNSQWTLPANVVIPAGGSISVAATCTTPGAITAAPGTLVNIMTPTAGWQSVTNAAAATPGAPVETDVALRQRQSQSVSLPALTPLQAIQAAVQAVPGVTRAAVYENDTNLSDASGRPAHSITAVVEGGAPSAIAAAIGVKKAPGVTTYGTTTQTWVDPAGDSKTINFYVLTVVPITVNITLAALPGYLSTTADLVKASVAAYISQLGIGANCYLNRLFSPANLEGSIAIGATGKAQADLEALSKTFNVQSITQSRSGPPAASDVTIAFNEAASGAVANITITVV